MPRRPKPPPVYELHIEPLSYQAVAVPNAAATFVDDFDGIERPIDPKLVQQNAQHVRRAKSFNELVQAGIRRQEHSAQAMAQRQQELANEFIRKQMQPTLRTPAKPGQQVIPLGSGLVITNNAQPIPPWRRL